MSRGEGLIPLTKRPFEEAQELRRKGGSAKSERKTNSNRIKNLRHGKYLKVPENKNTPLFHLKLQQAYSKFGVNNPEMMRKHILETMALLTESLEENDSFQNIGAYLRLIMEIQDRLWSVNKGVVDGDLRDFMFVVIDTLSSREEWQSAIPEIEKKLEEKKVR